MTRLGLGASYRYVLTVPGRKTGRLYSTPVDVRRNLARIGDEVVGTAGATFGAAGVNLAAAAVLPHARGRGVYRALTLARWEAAERRGTPALTVQAGRLSLPILTKLGFTPVGEVRVYVDELEVPTTHA